MSSSNKPDEIEDIEKIELSDQSEGEADPSDQAVEVPVENDDLVDPKAEDSADADQIDAEVLEEPIKTPPVTEPEPQKTSGGFLPTVMGGVLAAGLGFGAAQFLGTTNADQAQLQSALDQQSRDIAALQKSVQALVDAPKVDIPDINAPLETLRSEMTGAIAGVSSDLSNISELLGAVDARLGVVEKRPVTTTDTSGAAAAYERELSEIRAELAAQQAKNDEMSAQVAAAAEAAKAEIDAASMRARAVEAQAALQAVQAALDAGTSYGASLAALPGDLPEGLTVSAQTGVATLPALKDSFDQYARRALSAALKETPGSSTQDRIESFLRSQLNIRSLAPRDGDDADAILSRAQGALAANDLPGALAAIDQLPASGQAAMANWTEQAKARVAAQEAIETLANSLNQN